MNQLDTTAVTEQIRRDFLYNEKNYPVNRYAEIMSCEPSTLQRYFVSFNLSISHPEGELERRVRMAAHQYMSMRTMLLLNRLMSMEPVSSEMLRKNIATVPTSSEVNFVMNPRTMETMPPIKDQIAGLRIGAVIEPAVRVKTGTTGMTAEYAIPDGIILVVSRRGFRGGARGSIPHAALCIHEPSEMVAEIDLEGDKVYGGVSGRVLPVVQGYCWQINRNVELDSFLSR